MAYQPNPQAPPRWRPQAIAAGRCRRDPPAPRRVDPERPGAQPPFWGSRTIERVPPKAVVPYLNKRMLYQFQWGYRKEGRSPAEYQEWAKDEFRPVLRRMLDIAIRKEILVPQAAYGYWRCAAEGNDVILFDTDGERELTGSHSRARTRKAGSASPISSTMRPTGGAT